MRALCLSYVPLVLASLVAAQEETPVDHSVHRFQVDTITGKSESLGEFAGDVLLLVNVASKCGLTPQYEGLQKLYETYNARGLEILGFPANEFGKQEPGTNDEIREFCTANYGVTFPMFSKIVVKGEGKAPLYTYLTEQSPFPGDIQWNFEKWIVNRSGEVVARFSPRTKPNDPALLRRLEVELATMQPKRIGWPSKDTGPGAQAIHTALALAKQEKKEVWIHFTAGWCGWCKRFEAFYALPAIRPLFERDFVHVAIDTETMSDGEAIRAMLADGKSTGIPFMAWLSNQGTLVAQSFDAKGENLGYPYEEAEIDAFMTILEARLRRASKDDVALIRRTLMERGEAGQKK